MTRQSWDGYFLQIAELVSTRSKDPSTKVGAVIVKDRRIVSTGYNGIPRNVSDDLIERYVKRPEKYKWVEHAERNAIYNAACEGTSTKDSTLYVTLSPCCDCARAIIQAGISRVVVAACIIEERWEQELELADAMLAEAGIQVEPPP